MEKARVYWKTKPVRKNSIIANDTLHSMDFTRDSDEIWQRTKFSKNALQFSTASKLFPIKWHSLSLIYSFVAKKINPFFRNEAVSKIEAPKGFVSINSKLVSCIIERNAGIYDAASFLKQSLCWLFSERDNLNNLHARQWLHFKVDLNFPKDCNLEERESAKERFALKQRQWNTDDQGNSCQIVSI